MGILNSLFKKKNEPNLSEIITEIPESWSVLTGHNKGKPMLVRKNLACNRIAGNKNYPTSCGIAFKLLSPNADGLPDIENEPELDNLEDDIFDFLQSDLNSIVPIVITTSGFKEFVIYTKDFAEFEVRLKKLKLKYPKYQLTTYNKPDQNWNTYKSFK
ncbi:DUF695 domain-containing protein [uncultured Roseivirga sp.]|uniref:DUF695 domain-containing protein n=1 Tax=uncultured Roseivirga sp. TaxID=543088 RepID=UPI0030DD4C55|tara:strand:+ start:38669 stop:39142 length:474 start_codon:yes stop_codon:yes gene_type:complete